MGKTLLLESPLRNRRDVVQLRIQAKQVARLLGFPALDQIEIACATFTVAADALRRKCKSLRFELDGDLMMVTAALADEAGGTPGFAKKMTGRMEFAAEDCRWIVVQLSNLMEVDVLEVVTEQNDELLKLIAALHCCRSDLERVQAPGSSPSAA